MKAFTKRMIWFFGYGLIDVLWIWMFYITHNYVPMNEYYSEGVMAISSLINLGIHYIPLIFMKDDKIPRRVKL